MGKPNDIEGTTPKPVARGGKAAPDGRAGHALQHPGHQKAAEQQAGTAATYSARRAMRRQPGRTTRGDDPC
jgi:hypothetical protein